MSPHRIDLGDRARVTAPGRLNGSLVEIISQRPAHAAGEPDQLCVRVLETREALYLPTSAIEIVEPAGSRWPT